MNFLVIDGNSIVNRAFYGIKLLNAKDGHFTNALFGFMNIFMSLTETYHPQAVAVAFDVHAPTFRHKMYDGYKAGRKRMPPELYEQMEPLKKLLAAYGCHIIEKEGYEADDILGTLSAATPAGDHCYIATGDRDSLQLVKDNVTVLLTSTRMGRTQTVEYTPEKLMEDYGVTPAGMIELKALQGDSSDNIPGVAGVGPKTAGELIQKYHTIDYIYDHLDTRITASKLADVCGLSESYLSRLFKQETGQTDQKSHGTNKERTDQSHGPMVVCDRESDRKSVNGSGYALKEKGSGSDRKDGVFLAIPAADVLHDHFSADEEQKD